MSEAPPKPIPSTEIVTDRLVLRPMCEADIAVTVEALGNLEVSGRLARVPHPYTESDARWWLEETRRGRARGLSEHFMLVPRAGGAAIGAIGLHGDDGGRRAEVGYWIVQSHWSRGYAREALAALVRHAFSTRSPTIWILEAKVHESNPASIRVLEACGFLDVDAVVCTSLATGTNSSARRFELRREGSEFTGS